MALWESVLFFPLHESNNLSKTNKRSESVSVVTESSHVVISLSVITSKLMWSRFIYKKVSKKTTGYSEDAHAIVQFLKGLGKKVFL